MRETAPQTLIELKPSKIDMGGVGVFAVWGIKSGRKVADGIEDKDFDHLVPWACLDSYENELRQKIREFCIGTPEGFIPPPDFDFNRLSIDWYFITPARAILVLMMMAISSLHRQPSKVIHTRFL